MYLALKAHQTTDEKIGTFFWADERGPEKPLAFRRSGDESARTVDEVCMPELVALASEILAQGNTGEDAILSMASEMGLQRLRAFNRGRFEEAMKKAMD